MSAKPDFFPKCLLPYLAPQIILLIFFSDFFDPTLVDAQFLQQPIVTRMWDELPGLHEYHKELGCDAVLVRYSA